MKIDRARNLTLNSNLNLFLLGHSNVYVCTHTNKIKRQKLWKKTFQQTTREKGLMSFLYMVGWTTSPDMASHQPLVSPTPP